jgi:hypothetical protein
MEHNGNNKTKSNTSTLSQKGEKKKNLGPLGAWRLTSLVARIFFFFKCRVPVFFIIFLPRLIMERGVKYGCVLTMTIHMHLLT